MNEKPFFSIIVPACEVGKFASEMLESVLSQTYSNFECIIGYEESSDDTLAVLKRVAGNDERIKIAVAPRSGSASAPRNYGIKHARGEWLVFLDGDDWLESNALELIAKKISETSPDLVICDAKTWSCQDNSPVSPICENKLIKSDSHFKSGAEFLKRSLIENTFRAAVWFYCVKTDIVRANNIMQPVGRLHQDNVWSYKVCVESGRSEMLNAATYNYRKRQHSVTWKIKPKSVYDMAQNVRDVIAEYSDLKRCGATPEQLEAVAYYLTNVLSPRFLKLGVFAPLPKSDCLAAVRSIIPDSTARRNILNIVSSVRISRRIGVWITLLGSLPTCFTIARLLAKYIYEPSRMLYAKLKK